MTVLTLRHAFVAATVPEIDVSHSCKTEIQMMNLVYSSPPSTTQRIPVKTDGKFLFVPVHRISRIESAGNYVEIVLYPEGRRLLVRKTLSSYEDTLDPSRFVRIHRSVIVNAEFIKEMRPCYTGEYKITMSGDQQLTLSRGYRKNLQRLLQTASTTRSDR